jgi:hypothetical protein
MGSWRDIRPILVTAYDLMEQSARGDTTVDAIADALGRSADDIQLGRDLRALHDADYMKCYFGGVELPLMVDGTEKGRQETQGWPGPRTAEAHVELLIELLKQRAEAPDIPREERTRLRAILDAVGKAGTQALGNVTAELVLRAGGAVV